MNDLDTKLVESFKNLIMQHIHVGNSIPTSIDDKDLTWEYVRWLNHCAIESLESAIIYITEQKGDE